MDKPVHIFIVEDEPRIARFLQIELDHEGFETAIESNGTLKAMARVPLSASCRRITTLFCSM